MCTHAGWGLTGLTRPRPVEQLGQPHCMHTPLSYYYSDYTIVHRLPPLSTPDLRTPSFQGPPASVQVPPKATQHPDRRTALRTIMRAWLPLSACVLDMVVDRLPHPREAAPERLPRLLPPASMQHLSPEQAQVQLSPGFRCSEVSGGALICR